MYRNNIFLYHMDFFDFRPRCTMRWIDQISSTLHTTVCDVIHTAEDRVRWRTIVHDKVICQHEDKRRKEDG